MSFVQFTAEFGFAETGDSRTARYARMKQLSMSLYNLLAAQSAINMPRPASGHDVKMNGLSFSRLTSGMKYVPQFGNSPAKLTMTAIHDLDGDLPNPYPDALVLAHNDYYEGYLATVQKAAVGNLQASFTACVKEVFDLLDAAATSLNSSHDAGAFVFRLEYAGINFGGLARGYHFPRG